MTSLRFGCALLLAMSAGGCTDLRSAAASSPLTITVDARARSRPISPYVYGINTLDATRGMEGVVTLVRFGGTRASTYNWENNASNCGHDPPGHQNDGYLCPSEEPGAAVLALLDRARELSAAALIQVPMMGYVAADRRADGDVGRTPDYLESRFLRSLPRGGRADPSDRVVHQDAFVRFVRREAEARGVTVFFSLDNEPGGWPHTHPRLRADRPVTYRELAETGAEYAAMIRDEAPRSRIFGPVSFGWPAMTHLARAPDANGRNFLAFYLDRMRREERRRGARVLDVLDVHWYPDVQVSGRRVASPDDDGDVARMRMQLPRSLYDPRFREPSWIVNDSIGGPIELLPRLSRTIRERYPGTHLAITEYAYGGGPHPSGAVAQADALGALGRHGAFAAAYWPLFDQRHDYALAAFRMFRRVDGEVSFGDRSIAAESSDLARLSAWASVDSRHAGRVVIVLVGKQDRAETARLTVRGSRATRARRFVLDHTAPQPNPAPDLERGESGAFEVPIPARSVTTLILEPG